VNLPVWLVWLAWQFFGRPNTSVVTYLLMYRFRNGDASPNVKLYLARSCYCDCVMIVL
jgi:hypothetical protein